MATFWTKNLNSPRLLLKLVGKIELRGPGPLVVNTVVNYRCTRVVLYAKMLKETEIQEKRLKKQGFFVIFL